MTLGLLADTRKSGSLLGERPSPGVHSAVSQLSPMRLLRTFSAVVDSTGRAPANVGAGASTPETLLLIPHQTAILNTQPPPKTNKQTKLAILQFPTSTLCPKRTGSLLFCSYSSLTLQTAFRSVKVHLLSRQYLLKSPGLWTVGSLRAGAGRSLCVPNLMQQSSFAF